MTEETAKRNDEAMTKARTHTHKNRFHYRFLGNIFKKRSKGSSDFLQSKKDSISRRSNPEYFAESSSIPNFCLIRFTI